MSKTKQSVEQIIGRKHQQARRRVKPEDQDDSEDSLEISIVFYDKNGRELEAEVE